ncbi:MAG: hypothetical protein M5U26_10360 [Planctomycetota bacterium]|nr:hypothetical protein [Planctomycetota bacterium]
MSKQTSRIKRRRRTNNELDALLQAVLAVIAEEGQLTIRHAFYRMTGLRLVNKTECAYKLLCSQLARWRRKGRVPWEAFVDNTRWHIASPSHDSIHEALLNTVATYRRNMWAQSDHYIEIWCEKDAIAGILVEVARTYGVPVFPCKGFASLSSLYSAAQTFETQIRAGKTVKIYFFGDHDPSGVHIDRSAENTLFEEFGVDVEFERVAVLHSHIKKFKLPTRPTKKTDSRAAGFRGNSVEIDTLAPSVLKQMVEDCIVRHLNKAEWERLKMIEKKERDSVASALIGLPNGSDPFVFAEAVNDALEGIGIEF